MNPLPTAPYKQHQLFIEALCQDWRESGIVTLEAKHTPRAQRVLEITRQTGAIASGTVATRASPEPRKLP